MELTSFRTIEWDSKSVTLLDQRKLPTHEVYVRYTRWSDLANAIRWMVVRGAPAIGITAAYAIVLSARQLQADGHKISLATLEETFHGLANTRPTAVNLFWALTRMKHVLDVCESDIDTLQRLEAEAIAIHEEDKAMCDDMGAHGARLLSEGSRVLTHCNAGALATGGSGTALAVIRHAHHSGRLTHVYADETRPFLQGSRLTSWELARDGIPVSVITDNMAAYMMQQGQVDAVIVGTDRVSANGDVANKIGTYGLAVLCRHHSIPFYVIAPTSTIDLDTANGTQIEIERRPDREVTHVGETQIVPTEVPVENPAFDVTPAELVTAIVTEKGIIRPPFNTGLVEHVASA